MGRQNLYAAALLVALASPVAICAQSTTGQSIINLLRAMSDKAHARASELSSAADTRAPELAVPLAYRSAAGPVDPANRNDPRNLDIAGVQLGMTPQQAAAALRAAGYSDTGTQAEQASYATDIKVEWSKAGPYPYPRGGLVARNIIWRKAGQEVRVDFVALPEGPVANEISFSAGDTNLSSETFAAQVRAKYGRPRNEDDSDMRWCTVKAPACEELNSATYPLLVAYPSNRSLTLTGNDPARSEALAARREADIALRKPPEATPAF